MQTPKENRQSISINPKNGVAYWNRGNAHTALRKIDDAIADYDQAIAINLKDFNSFNSRGKAYVAKGDSNRAVTDYTQAIQFNPSYVEAYDNRGLSYEALGRHAEAIADFRKARNRSTGPTRSASSSFACSASNRVPRSRLKRECLQVAHQRLADRHGGMSALEGKAENICSH
jgi:tetratricopeptide (TPR) repeat protein